MLLEEFSLKFQTGLHDCGPTCLEMIAHYYGKPTSSLTSLYEQCQQGEAGTSVMGLCDASRGLGLHCMVFKCTIDNLLNHIPLPVIVHWKNSHFIVVYDVDETAIYTADPARGYIKYTHLEFKKNWFSKEENGGVLIAFESNETQETMNIQQ